MNGLRHQKLTSYGVMVHFGYIVLFFTSFVSLRFAMNARLHI